MFILASQSPRRQALLKRVVNDFEVQPAQIDEHETPLTTPGDYVQTLAQRKGEAVAVQYPTATILAADTAISFQGTLYGKPKDRQDAYEMLRQLSGQTHQVYTGLWLMKDGLVQQKVVQTDVTFWHLSTAEIEQYLDQNEYADKAGAYGIQGAGALLINKINGDFYNVVGLPVSTVARMLQN
ncbi:Maf family protein [Latilactobacillus sakei]|uniref:Maf family protein n=1 Tax=Latilactobacillus sakei TaxID=1599 RepID=UPI003F52C40A